LPAISCPESPRSQINELAAFELYQEHKAEIRMKFFSLLILALCLIPVACGHKKAAYSDIQTDKDGSAVNQNSNQGPPEASGQAPANPPAQEPQQPSPAAAQPAPFKAPEFFDIDTGQIKDIPTYPRATRVSVQYGPLQGTQSAMIILQTGDPVEKVAAFYDRAIKTNGWKVVSDQRDKDILKIELQKGDRGEGLVRVIKDEKTGVVNIGLSRIEKPAQPGQ
jgi:hypothetical protein